MLRCVLAAAFLSVVAHVRAGENLSQPHFETHVRAILKKHCFQCHGEEEELGGGLDMRLVRFMETGGDSGAAIVQGDAEQSLLFQRVRDGEMPPDESKLLSSEEISVIEEWIAFGAKTVRPEPETIDESTFITEEERSHWSFQPIKRPDVPEVGDVNAVANPIDSFLLSKLEERGFAFSARADASTRLRRLYFDLHGLPPTPEAISVFRDSDDPLAWRDVIDELLSSHRYGERWSRHWLDVAGYADSEGYNDSDKERPNAWRYRDYVIRAFDDDKPYDRFLREQLAGDELITSPKNNLSAEDAELLTATGFLRMAPDGTVGASPDPMLAKNDCVADTIKVVSSSLLAMSVGCAQCHDHRYDPISQVDYYRFRAIFEPALNVQKWPVSSQRRLSLYTQADRVAAAKVEEEAKEIDAVRQEKLDTYIKKTFEKQLAGLPAEIHQAAREAHRTTAKKRTAEHKALFKKYPKLNVTASSLYLYDSKADKELKALSAKARDVRAMKPKQGYVRLLTEPAQPVPVTHVFFRGDHEQPRQAVEPGGLTVVSETSAVPTIGSNREDMATTGRRLALADRLTHPQHPLTARVIVNRVWMHHFGRGLVKSPSDFGVLGHRPTHPELLDWLASELIESGWSLKHLHRLILNTNAWQQALVQSDRLAQVDPDNDLYGGANLTRLDAEALRDGMLAIAGQLNSVAYGEAVPVMADRVGRFVVGKENLNAGRPGAKIDMKGEDLRRSVYIQVRRSRPLSVLSTFDRPLMTPNCDRRRPSTNSTQSLLMLNSDLLTEYSRAMSSRLQREVPDDLAEQVRRAWRLVYSRLPGDQELAETIGFLAEQAAIFAKQPTKKGPPKRTADEEALAVMCQMLLSSNEFLYVD